MNQETDNTNGYQCATIKDVLANTRDNYVSFNSQILTWQLLKTEICTSIMICNAMSNFLDLSEAKASAITQKIGRYYVTPIKHKLLLGNKDNISCSRFYFRSGIVGIQ